MSDEQDAPLATAPPGEHEDKVREGLRLFYSAHEQKKAVEAERDALAIKLAEAERSFQLLQQTHSGTSEKLAVMRARCEDFERQAIEARRERDEAMRRFTQLQAYVNTLATVFEDVHQEANQYAQETSQGMLGSQQQ